MITVKELREALARAEDDDVVVLAIANKHIVADDLPETVYFVSAVQKEGKILAIHTDAVKDNSQ